MENINKDIQKSIDKIQDDIKGCDKIKKLEQDLKKEEDINKNLKNSLDNI